VIVEIIDIRSRLDSDEVRQVIAASNSIEYPPSQREAETDKILAGYRRRTDELLLGAQSNGQLIGFMGLRWRGSHEATIRHIAVRRDFRNKGVGRRLVLFAMEHFELRSLEAETHLGAVEFYQRLGFSVTSLGEKYPGTERFLCRLDAPAP
jgi:ribosomal protein S18 acetylase RimI-like enzyme